MASGFPALISNDCHKLILGSMPGLESLKQQQYYAHPRNAFWPIMSTIAGFKLADYATNCQQLNLAGFALWDVIGSCDRPGSLDSAIITTSISVNNFQVLFNTYPSISNIYCNGGKSWDLFQRHIVKTGILPSYIHVYKLPSSSPAYAAVSYTDKLERWSAIIIPPGNNTHI